MVLALSANAATIDDALLVPPLDASGLAPSAAIRLAIGMLRVSAIAVLASPLLLIAWLIL